MNTAIAVMTETPERTHYQELDGSSIGSDFSEFERRGTQSGSQLRDSAYCYVLVIANTWSSGSFDSSSAVLRREVGATERAIPRFVSTADQIALAVHTLSFNKRQLSELFGVSRQAIYDWLNGGNVSEKNTRKLSELAKLLREITGDTKRPLYHRFTTQPLEEGKSSILDLLLAERWDKERILAQLRRARAMTAERDGMRNRGRRSTNRGEGKENLMDNLLSLGEGR